MPEFSPPAAARLFVAAGCAAAGGTSRSNKNLLRITEGGSESWGVTLWHKKAVLGVIIW